MRLAAGDTVLMLYEAANFDETQFAEPDRFAIDRSPNDHVAFGFGAHHCLGASLGRLELRVLFERVARPAPGPGPGRRHPAAHDHRHLLDARPLHADAPGLVDAVDRLRQPIWRRVGRRAGPTTAERVT